MSDDQAIEVVTPQFERTDGNEPVDVSDWDRAEFEALTEVSDETRIKLGMRKWDTETRRMLWLFSYERTLWLFPYEWHDHIPEGFEVTTISWETVEYRPEEFTDKRFGVLACGVVVDA